MDLKACIERLRDDVAWEGNLVNPFNLSTLGKTYQSAHPIPTLSECEDAWTEIQLEEKKNSKINEINKEKARVLSKGISVDQIETFDNETETYIISDGVIFDSDYYARTAYSDFKEELDIDPSYEEENWKSSNGFFAKMNASTYAKVRSAGKAQIKDIFKWLKKMYKDVYKAETVTEIDAIDTTYAPIP